MMLKALLKHTKMLLLHSETSHNPAPKSASSAAMKGKGTTISDKGENDQKTMNCCICKESVECFYSDIEFLKLSCVICVCQHSIMYMLKYFDFNATAL